MDPRIVGIVVWYSGVQGLSGVSEYFRSLFGDPKKRLIVFWAPLFFPRLGQRSIHRRLHRFGPKRSLPPAVALALDTRLRA